jgi:hypothetical protein
VAELGLVEIEPELSPAAAAKLVALGWYLSLQDCQSLFLEVFHVVGEKNKIFWRYAIQEKACMYDIRLTPRVRYNVGKENVHEQPRTCNCNSRLVMRGKLLASCRPR